MYSAAALWISLYYEKEHINEKIQFWFIKDDKVQFYEKKNVSMKILIENVKLRDIINRTL